MFSKKDAKTSPIDSLIGSGSRIEGNVIFSGGLRVDGHVKGNITAMGDKPGTLVLSEMAKVEGEINGTVAGPVHATEYVELLPKARVSGDVFYKSIEIHVGAIVMGKMMHEQGPSKDKVVEFKVTQPSNS
jgi:cytoskeletal protein CcmA (bactofilin family)